MSEDREQKTGRHADGSEPEEDVRLHVKGGRQAIDGQGDEEVRSGGAGRNDDEGGDDVEAHVKSAR